MAVTVDAVSSTNAGSGSTLTWSHTCGASADKLIVVATARDIGNTTDRVVSGVTYNGASFTKSNGHNYTSTDFNAEIWYLDSPDTGAAYDIVVTYAGSNNGIQGAAASVIGAASGAAESTNFATTASGSPGVTLTGTTSGAIVIGGYLSEQGLDRITSNDTPIYTADLGVFHGGAAYLIATGTTETLDWTDTDNDEPVVTVGASFAEAAAGATNITVQDATHSHTADSPAITQTHTITTQEASHSHTVDNSTITQTHPISTDSATHGHTADESTITQTISITPADASHAHTVDNSTITQTHVISTADASHGHTADSPTVTQTHSVSVNDSTHAHSADETTVDESNNITSVDSSHAHSVDSPVITQTHAISVDSAAHAHTADESTTTQTHVITSSGATHGHTSDNITVSVGAIDIAVQDATHAHSADNVTASVSSVNVSVNSALHGHTADNVNLYSTVYSYEDVVALPTNSNDLANLFNATDYSNVSADDNNYQDTEGSGFMVMMASEPNDNNTDNITLEWTGKSTLAPTSSTIYLQIWNANTASWETIDSDAAVAADTEVTLTGTKTSSLSNYYLTGNVVKGRVYQEVV